MTESEAAASIEAPCSMRSEFHIGGGRAYKSTHLSIHGSMSSLVIGQFVCIRSVVLLLEPSQLLPLYFEVYEDQEAMALKDYNEKQKILLNRATRSQSH